MLRRTLVRDMPDDTPVGEEIQIRASVHQLVTTFYDELSLSLYALQAIGNLTESSPTSTYLDIAMIAIADLLKTSSAINESLVQQDEGLRRQFVDQLGPLFQGASQVTAKQFREGEQARQVLAQSGSEAVVA